MSPQKIICTNNKKCVLSNTFSPTCQKKYTDISIMSVTFCNSGWSELFVKAFLWKLFLLLCFKMLSSNSQADTLQNFKLFFLHLTFCIQIGYFSILHVWNFLSWKIGGTLQHLKIVALSCALFCFVCCLLLFLFVCFCLHFQS